MQGAPGQLTEVICADLPEHRDLAALAKLIARFPQSKLEML